MTKEEFASLQKLHRLSGLSLLKFLQQKQISYSTYHYWKRKSTSVPDTETAGQDRALAPIRIKEPRVVPAYSVPGMTLCVP